MSHFKSSLNQNFLQYSPIPATFLVILARVSRGCVFICAAQILTEGLHLINYLLFEVLG